MTDLELLAIQHVAKMSDRIHASVKYIDKNFDAGDETSVNMLSHVDNSFKDIQIWLNSIASNYSQSKKYSL